MPIKKWKDQPHISLGFSWDCISISESIRFFVFHHCSAPPPSLNASQLLDVCFHKVFARKWCPPFDPWPWSSLWARNKVPRPSAGRVAASRTSCRPLWGAEPPPGQERWWTSRRSSPTEEEEGWKGSLRGAPTGETVTLKQIFHPWFVFMCECMFYLY